MKIVVDLLGADAPSSTLIEGAVDAVNLNKDLVVVLCGYDEDIVNSLKYFSYNSSQIEILPCKEEVTNEDSPTRAFKQKPESSLILGLKKVNEDKEVKGFVSCGSTGAVMVSAMFIVGRMEQISRPTLACSLLTSDNKPVCIVDCGANVDSKIEQMLDYAKMGTAFMKASGIENPRVSLLSNGAEEKKGNELVKESHILFKEQNFNFIGNIEGKEALSGKTDVIVTDGFAGNVLLKSIEGAAKTVFTDLVRMSKKASAEEGKTLMNAVQSLLYKYDYNSKGGAILLGINTVLVKGHGAANKETIYSCINQAYMLAKNNLVEQIKAMY